MWEIAKLFTPNSELPSPHQLADYEWKIYNLLRAES
jgi:hypothetical protein